MRLKFFFNSSKFERVMRFVLSLFTLFAVSLFILILGTMVFHGLERLGLSFLFSPSAGAGYSGGIRYQLFGTGILVLTGAAITIPFSVAYSLIFVYFNQKQRTRGLLLLVLHLLNATPSILFGVLGYLLFYKGLGWQKSWLSGGIILATMMLPTVTESLVERMKTIPKEYLEAAQAMGLKEDKVTTVILIPYAWGGLLTGLVLGIARAAGETAPILFTAAVFSGATLPTGIIDNPVLALPYHIFNLAQDVHGTGGMKTAWATAVVLTLLTASLSLLASPFRARSHEEAKA